MLSLLLYNPIFEKSDIPNLWINLEPRVHTNIREYWNHMGGSNYMLSQSTKLRRILKFALWYYETPILENPNRYLDGIDKVYRTICNNYQLTSGTVKPKLHTDFIMNKKFVIHCSKGNRSFATSLEYLTPIKVHGTNNTNLGLGHIEDISDDVIYVDLDICTLYESFILWGKKNKDSNIDRYLQTFLIPSFMISYFNATLLNVFLSGKMDEEVNRIKGVKQIDLYKELHKELPRFLKVFNKKRENSTYILNSIPVYNGTGMTTFSFLNISSDNNSLGFALMAKFKTLLMLWNNHPHLYSMDRVIINETLVLAERQLNAKLEEYGKEIDSELVEMIKTFKMEGYLNLSQ